MPDESRIVIHAGAPKCGSSAIQLALCRTPEFTGTGGQRHAYGYIDARGRLVTGAALTARSAMSSLGARASQNISNPDEARRLLGAAEPALARMIGSGTVPVLSCEGWCRAASHFAAAGTLNRLGGGAHVVVYVRPPVDWLNSAWWQWGVWTTADLDTFVRRNIVNVRWPQMIRAWSQVPGVAQVTVALADDVTTRFFTTLGAAAPPALRANAGVPAEFLLFLLRNRRYRPDAHSARTEFVVARHLSDRAWPPPWVMTAGHVATVFDALDGVPRNLSRWLSPADRAILAADRRWWTPDAYADRVPADLSRHATPEALAGLCGLLASARGRDRDAEERLARRKMAAATDPVAAADLRIAAHVDAMMRRHRVQAVGIALIRALRSALGGAAPPGSRPTASNRPIPR